MVYKRYFFHLLKRFRKVKGNLVIFVISILSELKGKKGLRVSVSGNLSFRYKKGVDFKEEREGHDAKGFLTMEGAEKRT